MATLSVVVTCFREGRYLEDALRSVRSQLAAAHELIVVNDASTDAETNRVCSQAAGDGVCVLKHKSNGGLSAARNSGASAASGDILVFLDGDDLLPAGALAAVENAFAAQPECDFLCGNYRRIDAASSALGEVDTGAIAPAGEVSPSLVMRNWILLGTSPIRKRLWKSIHGYDESPWLTNSVQDIDFFQRALAAGARGRHLPGILYEWRIRDGGMNATQSPLAHALLALKNRGIQSRFLREPEATIVNGALHSVYAHGDMTTFRQLYRRFGRAADWKNRLRYQSTFLGIILGKRQSLSRLRLTESELDNIATGTTPCPTGSRFYMRTPE